MEYILEKEHLERVSLGRLGIMTDGSYEFFMDLARATTKVSRPKLVIETQLKEPSYYGVSEVICAIAPFEWEEFSKDPLATYTPVVHVVDGSLYTTGI